MGCKFCQKINLNVEKQQGFHVREWSQCNVALSGNSIAKQLTSLRKKISKHKGSQPHINAEHIIEHSTYARNFLIASFKKYKITI